MLDKIDIQIIGLLKENSRIQWKEIGQQIHMTGQAVGNRIRKMEDEGIIQAYTILVNQLKLGKTCTAFITVLMKTAHHPDFLRFIEEKEIIIEAHRVSGEGCYILKVQADSQEILTYLLDEILQYGNYRLQLSIQQVKKLF